MPPDTAPRREELLLVDMIERTRAIADAIEGRTRSDLDVDDVLTGAVLWSLVVMGEAASRLPAEFVSRHADLPWRQVTGFRNLVVHAYERIEHDSVEDGHRGRTRVRPTAVARGPRRVSARRTSTG
jgi:uncharacterized protein with HEPN domain